MRVGLVPPRPLGSTLLSAMKRGFTWIASQFWSTTKPIFMVLMIWIIMPGGHLDWMMVFAPEYSRISAASFMSCFFFLIVFLVGEYVMDGTGPCVSPISGEVRTEFHEIKYGGLVPFLCQTLFPLFCLFIKNIANRGL